MSSRRIQDYRTAWREAGHAGDGDVVLRLPIYVANTMEKALAEPMDSTMHHYNRLRQALQRSAGGRPTAMLGPHELIALPPSPMMTWCGSAWYLARPKRWPNDCKPCRKPSACLGSSWSRMSEAASHRSRFCNRYVCLGRKLRHVCAPRLIETYGVDMPPTQKNGSEYTLPRKGLHTSTPQSWSRSCAAVV